MLLTSRFHMSGVYSTQRRNKKATSLAGLVAKPQGAARVEIRPVVYTR